MIRLNFDPDIQERIESELDPDGPVFSALPVRTQMVKLAPYLRVQEKRESTRGVQA